MTYQLLGGSMRGPRHFWPLRVSVPMRCWLVFHFQELVVVVGGLGRGPMMLEVLVVVYATNFVLCTWVHPILYI